MNNLADKSRAITAEDIIRRYDLNSLGKNRKAIETNKFGLDKTETILNNFIQSTLKGISEMEDQVDGKITTWFFNGVPTTSNTPASDWSINSTKNAHLGDLYYDKTNGNTYQFVVNSSGTYLWELVDNDDVNQAMALANSNPDTSDGDRTIFLLEPTTPYEVGDIWLKENGDIYRCNVARASGDFNEAEWVISSEYSNDNYIYDARAILDTFTETVTANYITKVLVKTTKESIELSVSGVSGSNGKVTAASIVLAINNSSSFVQIDADKINLNANDVLNILAGNTINLTSKNIEIDSTYWDVDKYGTNIITDDGSAYGLLPRLIIDSNNNAYKTQISSGAIAWYQNGTLKAYFTFANGYPAFTLTDGVNTTTVSPTGVVTT
ncbi:MAG: hypothetical protein LIR50_07195 [Bacillota bacterium]|nr:hypothetical protein [Bacillota bacterium]